MLLSPSELGKLIASRAKERRVALKLRQIDLAERAGVTLSSLKRFENRGEGSLTLVVRIAFALRSEREFERLFTPPPEERSLDDVVAARHARRRVRR